MILRISIRKDINDINENKNFKNDINNYVIKIICLMSVI